MKLIHIIAGLALATAPLAAQVPVYLDETKPIETASRMRSAE